MDIYLVGGAVRDSLLGLPVKEQDWVVVRGLRSDGRLLVRLDDGTEVAVLGPIAVPDLASMDRGR